MILVSCGPDVLNVQVTGASWRPEDGWELTTETGRGQKRRGQHSSLILADQMNVREGASSLSACRIAAMAPDLPLAGVLSRHCTVLDVSAAETLCQCMCDTSPGYSLASCLLCVGSCA